MMQKTIIWIVKGANEEHKQAIEWLNEHSDANINLFLVKVELFRIGDSEIVPHFEIVSQPNDWTKTIRTTQNNSKLTGMELTYLNFWQGFNEYCTEHKNSFSQRKALPKNWYNFAIGSSECVIDLTVLKGGEIACGLWTDNKELYNKLYSNKESIENELRYKLIWDYKENGKARKVRTVCESKIDFKLDDLMSMV